MQFVGTRGQTRRAPSSPAVRAHTPPGRSAAPPEDIELMAGAEAGSQADLARWMLLPPQHQGGLQACIQPSDKPLLFCIPQAGMGAYAYHNLAAQLLHTAVVLPVELPGHNSRLREPLSTSLVGLAQQIAHVISTISRSAQGRPYAVLGHSMGAWLAYEVVQLPPSRLQYVQELLRLGLPAPCHLFVVSNRAPQLCGSQHDVDPVKMHELSFDDFWTAFERRYGQNKTLEHVAVRKALWPVLRADFQMLETYAHGAAVTVPLPMPLTVVAGEQDNRFTRAQVAAWQTLAGDAYREVWLPGAGHNCVMDPPQLLVQTLLTALQAARQQHLPAPL